MLEDINKSNHVEVDQVTNLDLSPDWRHATRSITTISMARTPTNESNKILNEMECDNNEVAQDDVESAASLLREGRLSGEVNEAARTCYKRAKGVICS